jgi:hypothetical protein
MPDLTREQQLYADLMGEARVRIDAIKSAIDARDRWAPRLLQEFAYLQLRLLCETIAVGCLIAHGNIKDRSALGSWKVPLIMKTLEGLERSYYPTGIRMQYPKTGGLHLADYNVPQLSKQELIRLWEISGAFVHRGSFKSMLAAHGKPLVVNLDPIIQYHQKIVHLLDQHFIVGSDGKTSYVIALSHPDANGGTLLAIGKAP